MTLSYSTLVVAGLAVAVALSQQPQAAPPESFGDYWDRGMAEVARYELSQSRYGESREGHAILVFVAEDFRRDTQVKDERGAPAAQSVRVLKLNRIQRFTTGIYDYSLMQSVFTPVDRDADPLTIKTTTSVQDWCGHVWAQLNLDDGAYRFTGHSYFEAEGDEAFEVPAVFLEDGLMNQIRIEPRALPTGELDVIPGMFDSRLRHRRPRAERAIASLRDGPNVEERLYELRYASGRRVEVTFERARPHGILAFREIVGRQVTEARRTHVEQTAYWNRSSRRYGSERSKLGLEPGDIGRK